MERNTGQHFGVKREKKGWVKDERNTKQERHQRVSDKTNGFLNFHSVSMGKQSKVADTHAAALTTNLSKFVDSSFTIKW